MVTGGGGGVQADTKGTVVDVSEAETGQAGYPPFTSPPFASKAGQGVGQDPFVTMKLREAETVLAEQLGKHDACREEGG